MDFPGVTGCPVRNLKYMEKFASKFSDIVQAVLAQLSVSTKSTTLSKDKRNHCGKALFCVFPPIPPFQRKTAPQAALPLLTAVFLFKVSLRRHMSACVTNFKIYSFFDKLNCASGTCTINMVSQYIQFDSFLKNIG